MFQDFHKGGDIVSTVVYMENMRFGKVLKYVRLLYHAAVGHGNPNFAGMRV